MLKTTLSVLGLLALSALPVLANPTSLVISQEFDKAQKLEVSQNSDHFLDFSQSGYRVLKAYPSNYKQFRAVALSSADNQQLVLKWMQGSNAPEATLALKVAGPLGDKTLRYRVVRVKKTPANILTMYTAKPSRPKVAIVPTYKGNQPRFDSSHSGPLEPVQLQLTPEVRKPAVKPKAAPVKVVPKSLRAAVRTTATSQQLIDRSSLSNPALANYLLRGLSRARGLKQINRTHRFYRQAQSAARVLRRGGSIERALGASRLPRETFDNLLGHGGVSK